MLFRYLFYIFIGLFISFDSSSYNCDSDNNYFFRINIPKINLEQSVYKYNDDKNDVNKGIFLVKDYDFNSFKGSLILASHSGNSSISHFKNLDLLKKGDIVKIIYNNSIIYYKITDKYKINKTGKFKYKNDDKIIYLITCDKNNSKKQLVIKANMVKISKKSTFF